MAYQPRMCSWASDYVLTGARAEAPRYERTKCVGNRSAGALALALPRARGHCFSRARGHKSTPYSRVVTRITKEEDYGFAFPVQSPAVPESGAALSSFVMGAVRSVRARHPHASRDQRRPRVRPALHLRPDDPQGAGPANGITKRIDDPLRISTGSSRRPAALPMDHVKGIPDTIRRSTPHDSRDGGSSPRVHDGRAETFPSVSKVYFLECNANNRRSGPNGDSVQPCTDDELQ